jgi:poly(A) polymerase
LRFRYSTEKNGKPVKKAFVFTQNEHRINLSDVDSQAVYIIERLQASGYETYIVGGAVRDLILGKKPKDFDIVTAANPARIKKIFRNARIIGRRFRLVHIFFGPKIFEVSTFRSIKEGPTGNIFGTIEEDVQRRDFSLNALFYDPIKQIVVDYVGGMRDIRKRIIRPIISLSHIFTDDPVRMIRAVKYAAMSGFRLPPSLKWRIRKHSPLLANISPSRLTEEIFKIIHSPCVSEIVEALDALGLYRYLQPGAVDLFKAKPGFRVRCLETLGKLNHEDFKNAPGEALSALIRDYLEDIVDWDGSRNVEQDLQSMLSPESPPSNPQSPAERYKSAFYLARKFVLPMNPPRAELDSSVRLLFAEHGHPIKKARFAERHAGSSRIRKAKHLRDEGKNRLSEQDDTGRVVKENAQEPKRRRHRRRAGPSSGSQ